MNIEVLWDGTSGLSSLSEKTRKSNRLQMSLQRQHFLLSVGPAGVRTHDLPHGSPVLNQLSQPVGGTIVHLFIAVAWKKYERTWLYFLLRKPASYIWVTFFKNRITQNLQYCLTIPWSIDADWRNNSFACENNIQMWICWRPLGIHDCFVRWGYNQEIFRTTAKGFLILANISTSTASVLQLGQSESPS